MWKATARHGVCILLGKARVNSDKDGALKANGLLIDCGILGRSKIVCLQEGVMFVVGCFKSIISCSFLK